MPNHSHLPGLKNIGVELSDVFVEDIFPTKLYSAILDVDNNEIIDECYNMRTRDPEGKQFSNYNGWQSVSYSGKDLACWNEYPGISELGAKMILFANDACGSEDLEIEFSQGNITWWVNINNQFCYNVFHSHPKTDMVGLYYPKIEQDEPQGKITLVRTDGSMNHELYSNRGDYNYFDIKAEEGRAYLFPAHLLHFVSPNHTMKDRISISFNIFRDHQ